MDTQSRINAFFTPNRNREVKKLKPKEPTPTAQSNQENNDGDEDISSPSRLKRQNRGDSAFVDKYVKRYMPKLGKIPRAVIAGMLFIVASRILYLLCEYLHNRLECSNVFNFYSMWCYAIKKCRSFLEEHNYDIAYTTLTTVGAYVIFVLITTKDQILSALK
jgi:hypothetical protein